jgi:hypothetical protein
MRPPPSSGFSSAGSTGDGAESWKRAAEVTQNLKARIEMMKVRNLTTVDQTGTNSSRPNKGCPLQSGDFGCYKLHSCMYLNSVGLQT